MDDGDYLSVWKELPHALNVLFTCAMQLLGVTLIVGLIGYYLYEYLLSHLI